MLDKPPFHREKGWNIAPPGAWKLSPGNGNAEPRFSSLPASKPDWDNIRRCLWCDCKPCARLFRCDQLAVVPVNHLWRRSCFQRNAVHILNLCESIADERMTQRILFPLEPGIIGSVPYCLEETIFAVRPCARSIARRNRQPARKVVKDWHDSASGCFCFVRCDFDESRPALYVCPIEP